MFSHMVFIPKPSLSICLFLAEILGFIVPLHMEIAPTTQRTPHVQQSSVTPVRRLGWKRKTKDNRQLQVVDSFFPVQEIREHLPRGVGLLKRTNPEGPSLLFNLGQVSTFPCPWDFFSMNHVQSIVFLFVFFFLVQVSVRNSLMQFR